MNNQSPLIPQGSLLEQKNKGRVRVKIAVFFVLAVHGIGLMALLMQGCQKDKESATQIANTNPPPTFEPPTNQPSSAPATNVEATPTATNTTPAPEPAPQTNVASTPPPLTAPPTAPVPEPTEYAVMKGDTFATIAKKHHVSLKAIMDANPGVASNKLKVGQKIHVPAGAATTPPAQSSSPSAPAAAPSSDTAAEHVYSVKSGDTLTKIATQFGTTPKALRSFNALKTDKIKVGQKIKIPAKAGNASATPSLSVEPAATPNPSSATGAPPTH